MAVERGVLGEKSALGRMKDLRGIWVMLEGFTRASSEETKISGSQQDEEPVRTFLGSFMLCAMLSASGAACGRSNYWARILRGTMGPDQAATGWKDSQDVAKVGRVQ